MRASDETMQDAEASRLVRVASMALRLARRCMREYACVTSRHDFTQPQLMACLVLKAITRNDYRGVCDLLTVAPILRETLGLEKVPHWTTLQKFMARGHVPQIVDHMLGEIVKAVGAADQPVDVAVDSTGLQCGVASLHYQTRRGLPRTMRKTVKVSLAVLCGWLLPTAVVVDIGSSSDLVQMPALMERIQQRTTPVALLADAGYDAEWVHEVCREQWHVHSAIPAVIRTADGTIRTKWRARMRELPALYGRRWHAESFMSGFKRTTMSTLASRRVATLLAEASIKVLAYAIRR